MITNVIFRRLRKNSPTLPLSAQVGGPWPKRWLLPRQLLLVKHLLLARHRLAPAGLGLERSSLRR
jgi:hypothetical protein